MEKGENVVLVGEMEGREMKVVIGEWMGEGRGGFGGRKDGEGWEVKKEVIGLDEGVKVIDVEKGGNV